MPPWLWAGAGLPRPLSWSDDVWGDDEYTGDFGGEKAVLISPPALLPLKRVRAPD